MIDLIVVIVTLDDDLLKTLSLVKRTLKKAFPSISFSQFGDDPFLIPRRFNNAVKSLAKSTGDAR